jgi:hypothetical protein
VATSKPTTTDGSLSSRHFVVTQLQLKFSLTSKNEKPDNTRGESYVRDGGRIPSKIDSVLGRGKSRNVAAAQMVKELLIAFGVMGICLVIHVTGIILITDALVRQRQRIQERTGLAYAACLLMIVFTALITLHLSEAVIWAVFYSWNGLFLDFETSLYFSLSSYTTAGYGEVLLPRSWRLLGTIEAISGVLLCGLSAAFLFAIVNALFRFGVYAYRREQAHQTES